LPVASRTGSSPPAGRHGLILCFSFIKDWVEKKVRRPVIVQIAFLDGVVQSRVVALHHLFEHSGRRDARKVRPARRHRERQTKADQIVDRVADDRLIEVANLYGNLAVGVCDRAEIADMTIAADPDRRSVGNGAALCAVQPLIEFGCTASHKGVRRACHFQVSGLEQDGSPVVRILGNASR
jgi:hypothetical protein